MSIEKKRNIAHEYCFNSRCEDCVLKDQEWTHSLNSRGEKCISIKDASEEELDKALALIHGDTNLSKEEVRGIFGIDPIKPDYYNDSKITPFNVIDDWNLDFYLGNAVKYIKRAGKKKDNSRLQDLEKIREYIEQEIRLERSREDEHV